ncbi:MAG: iron ABC transporter permease [Treponemataceae bacterium]|nr:iron ABC transporter permease [Treponemataceae bacterium]
MTNFIKGKDKALYAVWCFCLLFLLLFIVFPLLCVFLQPKISDFAQFFSNKRYLQIIANTALECVCSTSLSVLVGYFFAYAVAFKRIPGAKFFASLPVLHLITPPFVGGLAFILLVGRQGFITKTILHLDISLYGFWGLLLAQVLCFFPMAYLICAQSFAAVNYNLVLAAQNMGAGNFKIFRTVILPLTKPAILSSALFIGVSVLSDFGNPMIVAGRFKVLAVEIYTQLTGWINCSASALLGISLLIPSTGLFIAQNHLQKLNFEKTATIGGKSLLQAEGGKAQNDAKSRIVLFVFCSVISVCVLAQFAAIIAGSFEQLWGIKTNFTTEHIKAVARYGREIKNSLIFALCGATLSTILSCVAAFLAQRTNVPLKKCIDSLCQLPSAVPGSLFGLAFSLAANILHLRAPAFFIIIAITVGFMPFSYRIICSSYAQIKPNLDAAAQTLGQKPLGILATILLPLSVEGVFSGMVYNFARGVGTVSAVIFLVSFKTPLASIAILNLAEQGDWGKSAALALVLTIITFLILALGKALSSRLTTKGKTDGK